jgi:periplasmic protein TonB
LRNEAFPSRPDCSAGALPQSARLAFLRPVRLDPIPMLRTLNPMPLGPSLGVWAVVIGLHGALLALLLDMAPPREAPRIEPTVWTQLAEPPKATTLTPPARLRERTPEAPKTRASPAKEERPVTQPASPERQLATSLPPAGPKAVPNAMPSAGPSAGPSPQPTGTPAVEPTPRASAAEPARPVAAAPIAPASVPAQPASAPPSAAQATPAAASPSVTSSSPNPTLASGATVPPSAGNASRSASSSATGNPGGGTPGNPSSTPSAATRVAATPARIQLPGCEPNQGDYPLAARDAEVEGTTRVSLAVDASGKLVDRQILRSAGPTPEHRLLDRVALDKLSRCRFTPGRNEGGEPVASRIQLDIVWRLD